MKVQRSNLFSILGIILILLGISVNASTKLEDRMNLLKKLDMLDSLDFQDNIDKANKCTKKRNFECSKEKIQMAQKLASSRTEKKELAFAQLNLDEEVESLRVEKELIATQKEIQVKMARIRREMREAEEEEAERREEAEEEERRARAKKNSGPSFGQLAALAGGAYLANQSDLSGSDKTEFFSNYAADVMSAEETGGSMQNLEAWSEKKTNELNTLRAQYKKLELTQAKKKKSEPINKYYQESLDRVKKYEDSKQSKGVSNYPSYTTNPKKGKSLYDLRDDCEDKEGSFNAATRNCTIVQIHDTVVLKDLGINRPYRSESPSSNQGGKGKGSNGNNGNNGGKSSSDGSGSGTEGSQGRSQNGLGTDKGSNAEEYPFKIREARAMCFVHYTKRGTEKWMCQGPSQRLLVSEESEEAGLKYIGCKNVRQKYHNIRVSLRSGKELKFDRGFAYACGRPFTRHESERWDRYKKYRIWYPANVIFGTYECNTDILSKTEFRKNCPKRVNFLED